MTTDGLIDGKALRAFLIERKMAALENERRSTGAAAVGMGAQVRVLDALLIYLNSKMEEKDTMGLKLTLETTPIPTKQIKAESEQNAELTSALIELAKNVPEGHSIPLNNLGNLKVTSVSSKMWALRSTGKLPPGIVPLVQKGKLYMAHKTADELARMRKSKTQK